MASVWAWDLVLCPQVSEMPWRVLGEATFLVVAEPAPPEWLLAKLVEREAATLPVLGLLLAI